MRPLTRFTPKPLLSVADEPLLQRHLTAVAAAGISDVVINLHHLGDQIRAFVGDGSRFGVSVRYMTETVLLETAGGIANALHQGNRGIEPFLVVSGDVYTDMDFGQVVTEGASMVTDPMTLASLVLVPNPPHHPTGDFGLDEQGRLTTSGERLTYSGVGVFSPSLFVNSPDRPAPMRDLLIPAAEDGLLAGALYKGAWEDVGTPDRLRILSDRQQTLKQAERQAL